MSGIIAKKYFLGQGVPRLGCAQAVAESVRDRLGLDDAFVLSLAFATGGRAPSGYCGALYAALCLAEKKMPHRKPEIERSFRDLGGGLTCREIRSCRKMTCVECVEYAANIFSGDGEKRRM